MSGFVATADVLQAEVAWVLKCVNSHYSVNSCSDFGELFRPMFPDSTVAQQFTCGERKSGYLTTFGLGPYFADQMAVSTMKAVSVYRIVSRECRSLICRSRVVRKN